jgi:methanogenesis imperfect marker protein 11
MIIYTPEQVRERFGPLFSKKFLVMVDEQAGIAEILEQCQSRGTIEWDAMNRARARGAVITCAVEGAAMTIQARIGTYPVNFGSAGDTIGGQALEGVEVNGDEVITIWRGIAGAGVGIAACLPQAPGVIRAEYPTEEDLLVGGARTNHVRIVSPRYEKITIGIDDTDTKTEGATWVMALKCAEACTIQGVEFLNMRLIQLNPDVPNKTTNCVGSALNFAVLPEKVEALLEYVREYVLTHTHSEEAGIAWFSGITLPDTGDLATRVKTEILTVDQATAGAEACGIQFLLPVPTKGRIGALGAVLWANEGVEAAGLYGEHL